MKDLDTGTLAAIAAGVVAAVGAVLKWAPQKLKSERLTKAQRDRFMKLQHALEDAMDDVRTERERRITAEQECVLLRAEKAAWVKRWDKVKPTLKPEVRQFVDTGFQPPKDI